MLYILAMMISYQLIIYISSEQCCVLVLFFIYFDKAILMNVNQHSHIRWLTLSVLVPHLHNPTQVKLWRFLQSLHSLNVCKAHICLMCHSFCCVLKCMSSSKKESLNIQKENLFYFLAISISSWNFSITQNKSYVL